MPSEKAGCGRVNAQHCLRAFQHTFALKVAIELDGHALDIDLILLEVSANRYMRPRRAETADLDSQWFSTSLTRYT